MKSYLSSFLLLIITGSWFSAFGQTAPGIASENNYGGSNWEQHATVIETTDGGYAMVAGTSSTDGDITVPLHSSNADVWLTKLDHDKNILWQKAYGGAGTEDAKDILQTSDDGFIILAQSSSTELNGNHLSDDYWVIKTDASGEVEWDKCYGSNGGEYPWSMIADGEGNFILTGSSFSNGGDVHTHIGGSDAWLIKIDIDGNIIWENSYGGSNLEGANAICVASDGGFIVAAGSTSNNFDVTGHHGTVTTSDYWIFKINTDGVLQWQTSIGGTKNDSPVSIKPVSDGGYIVNGESNSNDGDVTGHHGLTTRNDIWVIKINAAGILQWQKSLGGSAYDTGQDAFESEPGKYIICGGASSADGDITDHKGDVLAWDAWVAELDDTGSLLWSGSYGGSLSEIASSMFPIANGNILLSCFSESTDGDVSENNGTRDIWLLELQTACAVDNSLSLDGENAFCKGDMVTISAAEDISYTYQWKKNGSDIAGAITHMYTANKTGIYQVLVSNGSCSLISDEINITVHAKPNAVITNPDITNDLCTDSSIKLKANGGAGFTYQWYIGGLAIPGANANIYFATAAGNYKVNVGNSYGCRKFSSVYPIIQSCKVTTGEMNEITLFPNPSNGDFTLSIPVTYNEDMKAVIKSAAGAILYDQSISAGNNKITLSYLPAGIYFITIEQEANVHFLKFIKTE